jgi:hypothetical protein
MNQDKFVTPKKKIDYVCPGAPIKKNNVNNFGIKICQDAPCYFVCKKRLFENVHPRTSIKKVQ